MTSSNITTRYAERHPYGNFPDHFQVLEQIFSRLDRSALQAMASTSKNFRKFFSNYAKIRVQNFLSINVEKDNPLNHMEFKAGHISKLFAKYIASSYQPKTMLTLPTPTLRKTNKRRRQRQKSSTGSPLVHRKRNRRPLSTRISIMNFLAKCDTVMKKLEINQANFGNIQKSKYFIPEKNAQKMITYANISRHNIRSIHEEIRGVFRTCYAALNDKNREFIDTYLKVFLQIDEINHENRYEDLASLYDAFEALTENFNT